MYFPCTFEKNVHSAVVVWNILYMFLRFIWSIVLFKNSISLSIFDLIVLSISKMRHWNTLLLLFVLFISLQFCQCFLHMFRCSDSMCIYIYNVVSPGEFTLLSLHNVFFLSCDSYFWLKVYFVWYKYDHSVLFWLPFVWNIFLLSLTFSVMCFLKSKDIIGRWQVGGTNFFPPFSHFI